MVLNTILLVLQQQLNLIPMDLTLFTGAVEFGQFDTCMSQIAAEELGVSLNDIILVSADSEICPIDRGNWLSGVHL